MPIQCTASLTINGIEMIWDEDSRRVLKPCFKCAAPTKGRMSAGGIRTPACITHALDSAFDKALKRTAPAKRKKAA